MTHSKWLITLTPLALLAGCDNAPQTKPAPEPDPALRAAVDSATIDYDACIQAGTKTKAAADKTLTVATAVAEAERECAPKREALSDAIKAFEHAKDPTIPDYELKAIALASIESIAPQVREHAAVQALEAQRAMKPDAANTPTDGQDQNASN